MRAIYTLIYCVHKLPKITSSLRFHCSHATHMLRHFTSAALTMLSCGFTCHGVILNLTESLKPKGSVFRLFHIFSYGINCEQTNPPSTGRYFQKNRVGVCGPLAKILTLFMTKICDFFYPIYDLATDLLSYL